MRQIYSDVNNKLYRGEAREKRIRKIVKYNLKFELLYFSYLSIKLLISFF